VAHLQLKYGESADSLTHTALQTRTGKDNTFLLTNLPTDTQIFYKVTAETSDQSLASDTFSFSTAAQPSNVELNPWSLTLAHRNLVLRSGKVSAENQMQLLKLQQQAELDVSLNLSDSPDLHQVELVLKGPETHVTSLTETGPGTFAQRVQLPITLGRYEVISRIADTFGNVAETTLQEIDIKPGLKVIDKQTGKPLAGASVSVAKANSATGGYDVLTDVGVLKNNPERSNDQGLVDMARVPGKYRVTASVPGYRPLQHEFELDTFGSKDFPQLELETAGNYWVGRLRYRISQQINWAWW
jgi:hypothetical protein